MWNRGLFVSACDLAIVSHATRCIVKALAEDPHWQRIEKYCNTAMQQNIIWSIAFKARTKKIVKEVYSSTGPHWISHCETSTKFEHNSIGLYPILFNQQGTT